MTFGIVFRREIRMEKKSRTTVEFRSIVAVHKTADAMRRVRAIFDRS